MYNFFDPVHLVHELAEVWHSKQGSVHVVQVKDTDVLPSGQAEMHCVPWR